MDVEFNDINGNHVGVDLNNMVSTQVTDLDTASVDLKSGDLVNAWIEYDDADRLFQVYVSYSTACPAEAVLACPIDLNCFINDFLFVGFSGSTQGSIKFHNIEWWSLACAGSSTSIGDPSPVSPSPPTLLPATNPPSAGLSPPSLAPSVSVYVAESPKNVSGSPKSPSSSSCQNNGLCRQGLTTVAGVATAGAFFLVAFTSLMVRLFAKRSKSMEKFDDLAVEIVRSPHEFSYRGRSRKRRDGR